MIDSVPQLGHSSTTMLPYGLPENRRKAILQGVGVILIAAVLFGSMALFVQVAARQMAATQIAFVRFTGSLAVLLSLSRGKSLRPQPGNLAPLLLRGALGGGAIMLYYTGIQYAGAGFATLLHCTYPVPTAVLAAAFMGEAFSARLGIALLLNFAGVLLVLGPGQDLAPSTLIGGLSALTASVLAGGAVTTARYLRGSESAFLITSYFMAVGMLLTSPSLLLGPPSFSPDLAFALLGVVLTSVAGQWMLHHGLGFASAAQGSLTAATAVLTATVLEALVLGKLPSRHVFYGAAFMITAVGLAAGRRARVPATAPAGLGNAMLDSGDVLGEGGSAKERR